MAPLNDRSYHAMHAKGSNDGDRVELDMGGKGPLNTWALNPKDVATFNYFIALQEVFKYLECPAEPASQVFINTQGDADQNGGTQAWIFIWVDAKKGWTIQNKKTCRYLSCARNCGYEPVKCDKKAVDETCYWQLSYMK